MAASSKATATHHPLDPLSASEINAVVKACKEHTTGKLGALRFNVVTLKEPSKVEVVQHSKDPSYHPPRRAFAILQTPETGGVYELVVGLRSEGGELEIGAEVLSCDQIEGVQPVATPDDCLEAEAIVKASREVRAALKERYGVEDMSRVRCDPWSVHSPPVEGRLIQTFMYLVSSPDDNQYAHPLDLVPLVDLNKGEVVRLEHYGPPKEVPSLDVNYHSSFTEGEWRTDIKPLDIVQPEGPSFTISGNLVQWQKWQFRVGFNYREGLVLHQVAYEDQGRLRPVMYRASLVEMAVPYGDAREPYQRKCAFDVGDYGLGYCTFPLTLGCDCLGHIKYFDAVLSNSKGEPVVLPHAVCMHEEDVGLLWKHVDFRTGHPESRRSRRLVISFIATVVNYEYAFYWYLYQDGTISFEIKLTGELSTNMLSPGEDHPECGTLVAPGVNAQHHQHLFCARLDMAVDDEDWGRPLVVSEVNVVPVPRGPKNPHGNAFVAVEDDLLRVHLAQRMTAPEQARIWKIKNPGIMNPITKAPVAYKLMPMASPPMLAAEDSLIAARGVFATKNLWVTPHKDDQKYPAGDYVLQSEVCRGLKEWTKEDATLVDADPVIWYTFGVTHIVRIEDFPVMPCEVVGFHLKPFGFFTQNPGVDLPPSKNTASRKVPCCGGMGNGTAIATNGSVPQNGAVVEDNTSAA